jgi:hypothetical protein
MTEIELQAFERYLRNEVPNGSGLRPFVCDGSPLECDVALIGYNPATSLQADFWDFWDTTRGFAKARWFETYKAERQSRPLKPGRTRRQAVSPTRKRIDLFIAGLGPHRCIETNLYWDASEDIKSHHGSDDHLGSLLQRLPKLRLAVCHHEDAYRYVKARFPSIAVEKVDHFANRKPGWSDGAALALGRRVSTLL